MFVIFCKFFLIYFVQIQFIFDDPDPDKYPEVLILSVDGVHCRIYEPRVDPSTGWYSKKFNKAGLTYELGIAIHHDKLVWIHGPFPAGQNDMGIFKKENGLLSRIPPGKKVIADEGYVGEPDCVATRNTFDCALLKQFKSRCKARHESFNGRLKVFGILDQAFRAQGDQRMQKHKVVFEACCVIVQYEIDNGHPLMPV